ncbi:MAG: alpha/beta fold hydrolase [Chitinivorax sp.]
MHEMLLALALGSPLAALLAHRKTARKLPELVYQFNPQNQQRLQNHTPANDPTFRPTPWMFNTHLQLLALGLKKGVGAGLAIRSVGTAEHGRWRHLPRYIGWGAESGRTSANAADPAHYYRLATQHAQLVQGLQQLTGWRVVLCQRRGHGDLPFDQPENQHHGRYRRFAEQIQSIRQRFPDSPLYAMGISAGTGLLVRYLGEQGADTPIRAAMAYCPGYDINVAFARSQPFYSRMMAKKLIRQFVSPQPSSLWPFADCGACSNALICTNCIQHLYEIAGYAARCVSPI